MNFPCFSPALLFCHLQFHAVNQYYVIGGYGFVICKYYINCLQVEVDQASVNVTINKNILKEFILRLFASAHVIN